MSRFWVIVFCLPLIFRRHVCLSKLKQSPSRELPLSAGKTVFSHLKGVFTWENSHRRESHTGIIFLFRIAFTWWLGHFRSRYLKVHFMLIKYTCDSKSQTLRMRYPFQSTGRPISHRNGWSFRPGTRTGVKARRGDSHRHDILWWYHVNKYRAMRGNRSELAPGRK